MNPSIVIIGFPSTDFVPGAYGVVKYGAGATSAASIPLRLLVCGMKAANNIGTSVQDAEVDFIPDLPTADLLYGAGSQLARACQAAVGIQGAQVYGAPVAVPNGAAQAAIYFTITAAQASACTLIVRVGGLTTSVGIGATDSAGTIATSLALAINGIPRCPFTASATGAVVTATVITPGLDGNSYICFVNTQYCPAVTVTMTGPAWTASTLETAGALVVPTVANNLYYKASAATLPTGAAATIVFAGGINTIAGLTGMTAGMVGLTITITGGADAGNRGAFTIATFISANSITVANAAGVTDVTVSTWTVSGMLTAPVQPSVGNTPPNAWPTTVGATITDGGVVWTAWGKIVTGGGVTPGGGAGLENVTNILEYIENVAYDRIALCQNDATNLGRWLAQVTAQAGPLTGLLQQVIFATNGTLTAATSLAQTTLNAQRFQGIWYLNSESHYSELAAVWAALRVVNEASDPDAGSVYAGMALPAIAPQSQQQDFPIHSVLVAALNSGVTPVSTNPSSEAVMVRSITTHSLDGTLPDYSCLDTCEAVVPDFVLKSLLLYWSSTFLPSNPRVAPDKLLQEPNYPSGVGTPRNWSATANSILNDFGNGIVQGLNVPPIIYNVAANPLVSTFDPTAKRIMSAVTVQPMPQNLQLGVSASQAP